MSYLSVLHGARGLFYFILTDPRGATLFERPEQLQAVTRVVREIKALQPVFEQGQRVALPFPPDPDSVEAGAWLFRGRRYVILVNRTAQSLLPVPEALLEGWRPLFEVKREARDLLVMTERGWSLPTHAVLVLEEGGWRKGSHLDSSIGTIPRHSD